ncbi:hypothetical protein J5U18_11475 [Sphingobacteriaceae bacterium WQ 2009]|uniref:Uncharacterized protein n=1 Tax=Rhinopithecimicrobium faecis TaxID=2820698 RepID=A0A8T4HBK7_9SPHI|nr:hypothetical protein [Sphingobacteriaceae bacterium WQ 2009]
MKNLEHQTKQAFLFSLAFYIFALLLLLVNPLFSKIVFSLALMISMLWVALVLKEIIFTTAISSLQKLGYILLIIVGNIFGGMVYFWVLRKYIIGSSSSKK